MRTGLGDHCLADFGVTVSLVGQRHDVVGGPVVLLRLERGRECMARILPRLGRRLHGQWINLERMNDALGCRRRSLPGRNTTSTMGAGKCRSGVGRLLISAIIELHFPGAPESESGGMVDALALGASGATRESSSLSFRTSGANALGIR